MSTPLIASQEFTVQIDSSSSLNDPAEDLRKWINDPENEAILLGFPAARQWLLRVSSEAPLRKLVQWLSEHGYFLVTLVVTDERDLVDKNYKLTYLFSYRGPWDGSNTVVNSDDFSVNDLLVFVEQPLENDEVFPSIQTSFEAVIPFQQHIIDMFGLWPNSKTLNATAYPGEWIHPSSNLFNSYPLRRLLHVGGAVPAVPAEVVSPAAAQPEPSTIEANASIKRDHSREWQLEVGPIHAGIIEPGRFEFHLAGEVVEKLTIHLGYTHKGIEQCFQTRRTLEDGWELAERVAGDSSFAHSLAYCQAVEALAGLKMPPEANKLRALCLELERIAAHIGDCGALAHDVAFDLPASELAGMREKVLQINERLFGSRLLRGLNRPGTFILPSNPSREKLAETRLELQSLAGSFDAWADALVDNPSFNDRLKWTGILPQSVAKSIGATGLIARASGILRDFRLLHPFGLYREDRAVRRMILEELPSGQRTTDRETTAGDTLARFLMRQREVRSSARIVDHVLEWWENYVGKSSHFNGAPDISIAEINSWKRPTDEGAQSREYHTTTSWPVKWHTVDNYSFGVGYVEGWRGDIIYWVMKNKLGRIFRCQPRDPSFINWPALEATINLRELDMDYIKDYEPPFRHVETLLSDFPIINKSFNLSYSGRDL